MFCESKRFFAVCLLLLGLTQPFLPSYIEYRDVNYAFIVLGYRGVFVCATFLSVQV